MDGVLVTGTATGVGKTPGAAALVRSRPCAVDAKPVQTGLAGDTLRQDLPEIAW